LRAVAYRARLPRWRTLGLGAALAAWFILLFLPWTLLADAWVADHLFAWMPSSITDLASTDTGGETPTGAAILVLAVVLWLLNGLLGPVTEELYFRGHLLPRLERYGRWAPVINTTLFSIYHFWSPWQILVRIAGFLPVSWVAWRTRSVYVSMAAHVMINTVFLAFLLLAMLAA
jgi:membrane protease YdiL (CAAX protease family)